MDIKILATDLDSTLLRTDKSVSGYTVSVLERCREKGILLAFATARSEMASERVRALVKPDIMITCGGALARHGEKILYYAPLSRETADAIVAYCGELSSVGSITAETADGFFVDNPVDPNAVGDYAHAVRHDFSRPFTCDVYKLVIQISGGADRRQLANAFPGVSIHGYTGSSWCFIADTAATKWLAVEAVAAALSVDTKKIVSFGDDSNDVEILKKCGIGVAMANAIPAAKEAADVVCGSCDEDGLARWIEENICVYSDVTP